MSTERRLDIVPTSMGSLDLNHDTDPTTLLCLPTEIIDHVISFLPLLSLIDLAATCRVLRANAVAEIHWHQRFLALDLPHQSDSPAPFRSWKE